MSRLVSHSLATVAKFDAAPQTQHGLVATLRCSPSNVVVRALPFLSVNAPRSLDRLSAPGSARRSCDGARAVVQPPRSIARGCRLLFVPQVDLPALFFPGGHPACTRIRAAVVVRLMVAGRNDSECNHGSSQPYSDATGRAGRCRRRMPARGLERATAQSGDDRTHHRRRQRRGEPAAPERLRSPGPVLCQSELTAARAAGWSVSNPAHFNRRPGLGAASRCSSSCRPPRAAQLAPGIAHKRHRGVRLPIRVQIRQLRILPSPPAMSNARRMTAHPALRAVAGLVPGCRRLDGGSGVRRRGTPG